MKKILCGLMLLVGVFVFIPGAYDLLRGGYATKPMMDPNALIRQDIINLIIGATLIVLGVVLLYYMMRSSKDEKIILDAAQKNTNEVLKHDSIRCLSCGHQSDSKNTYCIKCGKTL